MFNSEMSTFPALLLVLSIVPFVPAEELGGGLCSSASTTDCPKDYVCVTGTCKTCKEAVKLGEYPSECGLHPSIVVVLVIFGVVFWINVFAYCWLCDYCPLFKCRMSMKKNKGVEAGAGTVKIDGAFPAVGASAGAGAKAGAGGGLGDKAKSTSKLNLSISPSKTSQKLESKPDSKPAEANAAAPLTGKAAQKKNKKKTTKTSNSTPSPSSPPPPPSQNNFVSIE